MSINEMNQLTMAILGATISLLVAAVMRGNATSE
jgi:hypothetical protein